MRWLTFGNTAFKLCVVVTYDDMCLENKLCHSFNNKQHTIHFKTTSVRFFHFYRKSTRFLSTRSMSQCLFFDLNFGFTDLVHVLYF